VVTLLEIIMFLLAVALAIVIVRAIGKMLPAGTRGLLAKLVREMRILTGRYSVRDVVAVMLEQLYASALPSVNRSYLPNHVTFGLHPEDARRWGGFFPDLEREITMLLETRIKHSERLVLTGPLRIKIQIDQAARPGRPTYAGGTRPGAKAPERSGFDTAPRQDATATALTSTAFVETPLPHADTTLELNWKLLVDDEVSQGRAVPLFDGATIGRADAAGIRIHGRGVSREHAQVRFRPDGTLEIVDLESVNGTYLDGEKVSVASVASGQQIGFGHSITATVARD
jgi:hypothetical protein